MIRLASFKCAGRGVDESRVRSGSGVETKGFLFVHTFSTVQLIAFRGMVLCAFPCLRPIQSSPYNAVISLVYKFSVSRTDEAALHPSAASRLSRECNVLCTPQGRQDKVEWTKADVTRTVTRTVSLSAFLGRRP